MILAAVVTVLIQQLELQMKRCRLSRKRLLLLCGSAGINTTRAREQNWRRFPAATLLYVELGYQFPRRRFTFAE